MARNIVFVGNCQANSIHHLFAASIAPVTGDSVSFVPCFAELSENSGRLLMEADLVSFQILDSDQKVSLNKLRETREINFAAKVVEFPLVTGAFLWPHTGTKHPLNEALRFFPAGPFGSDFGDSFLNREISRGSDPAVALQKYLALDLGKSKDLDRLYELHRLSLQKKDRHSGFSCADYIDTWFRKERLFQTPTVVSRRLYLYLASEIFNRLGIPAALVERACANTPTPYAAHIELPLHPSIIRHFSLEFAKSTDRYHFYTDELFTFEQYAKRYLVYQFNKPLFKAIYAEDADMAVSAERKRKISKIRAGLSVSDGSGMAYFELSNLLMLEGDSAASLAEIKRACEFDPSNVRYQIFFANILKNENELNLAEDVLLAGLIQWPGVAALWHSLADIFRHQGRHDEATIAATRATEIEPYNPDFQRGLALSLLSGKNLPEARKAAQRAAALSPHDHHYQSLLGEVAMQAGDMQTAIDAFKSAAAISPEEPAFFRELAHCLSVKGQLAEAIEQMVKAVDLRPDSAENNAILAHFLASHGQIDEASPFLQRAISLAPGHLQYQEMAESLNRRRTASNVEYGPTTD